MSQSELHKAKDLLGSWKHIFSTGPADLGFTDLIEHEVTILNHLMHSKDAECILMFLSAMPRGVSVAHIYVLKLPLHHL